mgnify:CR=1 FL=1
MRPDGLEGIPPLSFHDLALQLESKLGSKATKAARAPGRVNLIGEHTDYNAGYVLPAALQFEVRAVGEARDDGLVRAYSTNFDEVAEFSLEEPLERSTEHTWINYIKGVAWALRKHGYPVLGLDLATWGNVPLSSGLSSSAAMEVCIATLFEGAMGVGIEGKEKALACQEAENGFVGVNCGIMDQFISALGEAGHALFIDTRTLDYRSVPLWETGYKLLIVNTNKPRQLVDSEYNARRAQCEQAVALLGREGVKCEALRDVSSQQLEEHQAALPEVVYRRARHVITEDERVLEAMEVLGQQDLEAFGELMNQSHNSLRDDYEVSSVELDLLVELARRVPGVLGSRMTGAGFGGCTVTLIDEGHAADFAAQVLPEYQRKTGLVPELWVCNASDGAELVELEEVL